MSTRDLALKQGTCAGLELRARRGPAALEKAIAGFTKRQRELVPVEFVTQLRLEAAQRADNEWRNTNELNYHG